MDIVIARQHPHDPERLQWRRESADGEALLAEGDWDGLIEACSGARLVWLVPTEQVLLTSVSIANRRELKRATPYALEDELAEDIESLHFAFGERDEGGITPVGVVRRETMATWNEPLKNRGLRPQAMVPDVLAVPRRAEHLTVVLEDARGLIRTGTASGLAADVETLAPLMDGAITQAAHPPEAIEVWRGPDVTLDTPRGPTPVNEQRWSDNVLGIVPAGWGRTVPLNLLQGDFRPARPPRRHAPWWIAGSLAAVWLVLIFTLDVLHYRELSTLKTEYQQAMRDLYFATFPDARKAPDPRLLMEQRLAALQRDAGAATGGGFITLTNATAQVLAETRDTRVNAIRFRDGRLDVELEAGDANTLDAIKQGIEAQGLRASLQSVDAQGDRVNGRLYVEPQ